jgi:hypothetical protein
MVSAINTSKVSFSSAVNAPKKSTSKVAPAVSVAVQYAAVTN